jgi:hypothetical protein
MTGRFKARLTILPGMIGSRGARLAGEAGASKGSGVVGPIVYLRSIVCEGVSSTVHLRGTSHHRGSRLNYRAQERDGFVSRFRPAHHGLASEAALHEARSTILDARNLDAARIRPQ